jgi:hypothetical protein
MDIGVSCDSEVQHETQQSVTATFGRGIAAKKRKKTQAGRAGRRGREDFEPRMLTRSHVLPVSTFQLSAFQVCSAYAGSVPGLEERPTGTNRSQTDQAV